MLQHQLSTIKWLKSVSETCSLQYSLKHPYRRNVDSKLTRKRTDSWVQSQTEVKKWIVKFVSYLFFQLPFFIGGKKKTDARKAPIVSLKNRKLKPVRAFVRERRGRFENLLKLITTFWPRTKFVNPKHNDTHYWRDSIRRITGFCSVSLLAISAGAGP